MSRESKQERLVRSVLGQISEHLHELKSFSQSENVRESDIERWCQSVLRTCLGFTVSDGYIIQAQESRGRSRPDLIIYKDQKPTIIVEVKRLGYDLDKSDFRSGKIQLSEYLKSIGGIRWGLLCNGYEWRLYDFNDPQNGGIEIVRFDLRNEDNEIELSKSEIEDACWDFIDLHENVFTNGEWEKYSKEETVFSADSLAKAILTYDSVRYLTKIIKGEHEYKTNVEVLIEKMFTLLEYGLNDSHGWNETKKAELKKYIKSQKRVGRKKRTQRKAKVQQSIASEESSASATDPKLNTTKVSA